MVSSSFQDVKVEFDGLTKRISRLIIRTIKNTQVDKMVTANVIVHNDLGNEFTVRLCSMRKLEFK